MQRALLAYLEQAGEVRTTRQCAAFVASGSESPGQPPARVTASQRSATGTALRALSARGVIGQVKTFPDNHGPSRWAVRAVADAENHRRRLRGRRSWPRDTFAAQDRTETAPGF